VDTGRPTEARIDLAAVRANAAEAQRLAGGRDVIAVVKADAYGHGAVPVGRALLEAGCERLAVLTVAEAAELREAAVAVPLLVLGGVHDAREAERAVALRLTCVVHHEEGLRLLAAAARRSGGRARIHLEVDTGMRRMGVPAELAPDFALAAGAEPRVEIEGVFTHLARADEADLRPSLEQLRSFRAVLELLASRGIRPPVVHVANSAGLLAGKRIEDALPEATAVRPGLMLYGVRPAPHLGQARLVPAMTLATRVVAVRDLRRGDRVGYGGTFRARRATRVATLALGYADGVPWSAAGRGAVWLAGARRQIAGRVSMDYLGVEAGDAPVAVGDEAIVFGRGAEGALPVEEAADAAATIAYELLVRVGSRVPRRYLR
jgi:alanine racemase